MIPDYRDIAALPTSWALTLWDALPIYLSIEVAFAIVVTATLSGVWRERLWHASVAFGLGGAVFLFTFDPGLAFILLVVSLAQTAAHARATPPDKAIPQNPTQALRERGGEVIGAVALAATAAALVKVLLIPEIAANSWLWYLVAPAGGLATPVPVGASAVPALAASTATGSIMSGTLWLAGAALRPFLWTRIAALRQDRQTASDSNPRETELPAR